MEALPEPAATTARSSPEATRHVMAGQRRTQGSELTSAAMVICATRVAKHECDIGTRREPAKM